MADTAKKLHSTAQELADEKTSPISSTEFYKDLQLRSSPTKVSGGNCIRSHENTIGITRSLKKRPAPPVPQKKKINSTPVATSTPGCKRKVEASNGSILAIERDVDSSKETGPEQCLKCFTNGEHIRHNDPTDANSTSSSSKVGFVTHPHNGEQSHTVQLTQGITIPGTRIMTHQVSQQEKGSNCFVPSHHFMLSSRAEQLLPLGYGGWIPTRQVHRNSPTKGESEERHQVRGIDIFILCFTYSYYPFLTCSDLLSLVWFTDTSIHSQRVSLMEGYLE